MPMEQKKYKRQWRFYRTQSGHSPVRDFLDTLAPEDAAGGADSMKEVAEEGMKAARHLRKEIWEVRVDGNKQSFRILFATEGHYQHILLALEGFSKKTQKTPLQKIDLAEDHLADWRERGRHG